MKICNIQLSSNNIENTSKLILELSSKLSKLENIMRVEISTLNFSIKDRLKIVSKTKTRNC